MADEPSSGEMHFLQRQVDRNHKDLVDAIEALGLRLEKYVLEPVYRAEYGALLHRVRELEKDAEDDRKAARDAEAANRQSIKNNRYTVITTVVAGVILAFVSMWLKTGGH